MNSWTQEKTNQFKYMLSNMPSEDAMVLTAYAWCKEFNLKFDANDEIIARNWHRMFHCNHDDKQYFIQVKDDRGNWVFVKDMSTKAESVWTCMYRDSSFMGPFEEGNTLNWKMAQSYVDALKSKGLEARLVLC